MQRYLLLCSAIIMLVFSSQAYGQTCTPGRKYPYTFCKNGVATVQCSACPQNSTLGTPLAPGLPTCVNTINDWIVTDPNGSQRHETDVISFGTIAPCNRLITTFTYSDLHADAMAAISNWDGICSPMKHSSCCWRVALTSNAGNIAILARGRRDAPAGTTIAYDHTSCQLKTGDCNNNGYLTLINVSQEFLQPVLIPDNGTTGTPCNVTANSNTWFDNAHRSAFTGVNTGIMYYNMVDVLTHELGHLLGYPEESSSAVAACPFNGPPSGSTTPESIMAGSWQSTGDLPNLGLPAKDAARCWFKQLYCGGACTEAVTLLDPVALQFAVTLAQHRLTVHYELQSSADVSITILDALGRPVSGPFESHQTPGEKEFKLTEHNMVPGVYFVRLTIDGIPQTRAVRIN